MSTLSELTNKIGFKADWKTLDSVKKRMLALKTQGNSLRRNIAKPLKLKMDASSTTAATRRISNLKQRASELRQTLAAPMRVRVDAGNLAAVRASMNQTAQQATRMRSLMGGGGLLGAGLAAGVGFLAGGALTAGAKGLFDINVEAARLSGALKTATGSTAAANAKFAELEKFGATTPYTLNESISAYIRLKNLGLDPSTRALRSFGNTATAQAKPMMDMVEAVADAATGEFARLKEVLGIMSKTTGDMVEFTFKGVKTKVKKDAKSITEYLMKIGETDFATAMSDQMNELPGIVSNVKDSFESLARSIGAGGLNDALKPILKEIGSGLSGIDGKAIGKVLGQALSGAVTFAKQLYDGIKEVITAIGGIETVAKTAGVALAVMMAPVIGGGAIAGFKGVVAAFGLVSGLFSGGLAAAASSIFAAIGGIPLAIGAAIIAVGVLAYDIYQFATGGKSMIGSLAKQFPQLGQALKWIGDQFKGIMPELQAAFTSLQNVGGQLIQFFMIVGQAIAGAFTAAMPILVGIGTILIQFIILAVQITASFLTMAGNIIAALLGLINFFLGGLVSMAVAVATFVGQAIGFVLMMIAQWSALYRSLLAALVNVIAMMVAAIVQFVTAMVQLLVSMWNSPKAAAASFGAAVTGIVNQIGSAFQRLGGIITSVFSSALGFARNMVNGLLNAVSGLVGRIKAAGSAAGQVGYSAPATGGGGSIFTAQIQLEQNNQFGSVSDPVRVGALVGQSAASGLGAGLSDFARSTPLLVPGNA